MNFRFLAPAIVEIHEAAEFYHQKASGLGLDFLNEVDVALGYIQGFPEAWGSLGGRYRRYHLRRFPYSVIYSLRNHSEILIISVFHQSREPQSWRKNL